MLQYSIVKYVSDLHLHSKYSRAVSKDMELPTMALWGRKKGIDILATGDWTHPLWVRELKSQLEEVHDGLYRLKGAPKSSKKEPLFLLSVEIASIFSHKGKLRRIHNLLFAPNFSVVDKISNELRRRGCNLSSDGRPIIGLSSKELLEVAFSVDRRVILIPCHVWTPHFGMYGSASGYDSILESFDKMGKYVYGIETGISSDPLMNWQIPDLDEKSILSFSDAHSPAKMGREVTVFELSTLSYNEIGRAIASPDDKNNIAYTVEFYPEEGKYHYTGHRNCKVILSPKESKEKGNICPVCKKRLTEGVLYRVEQLAGSSFDLSEQSDQDLQSVRWIRDPKRLRPPYVKLVPLLEVIAESLSATVSSGKVKELYHTLVDSLGSELAVLLEVDLQIIENHAGYKVADGVRRVRMGTIAVDPGYDGEYGKVNIWNHQEKPVEVMQKPDGAESQLGLF